MAPPSIREFYRNRSVFITGSTGFIGKVLVEKLLRSCPDLERIYVLIRPKNNENLATRMENLFNCKVFRRLQEESNHLMSKVVGVSGDIMAPGLGLSGADRELLTNDVSIAFHVAASIRFDDTLKFATEMNVVGAMRVAQLCKTMRKFRVLIHVSTAYSNCDRHQIDEEIYPTNLEPYRLLSLSDWVDEEVLETISLKLVDKKITTYHMTKSIAEKVLQEESENLPIVIVRPSVVVGAMQEPVLGWTETIYHINGILVGMGRGVLRVLHCDPDAHLDIVPVDLVANLLIAAAWEKPEERRANGVKVFNHVSAPENPLSYRQLRNFVLPVLRKDPLLYPVWYPYMSLVRYKIVALFMMLFLHWLPALVVDTALRVVGKPPRLCRVVKRIGKSQATSAFFLNNNFEFSNNHVRALWNSLSSEDKNEFCFDVKTISWKDYLKTYFLGCKQFVAKENLSTLPRARSQMRIMKFVYYLLTFLLIVLLAWICASYI